MTMGSFKEQVEGVKDIKKAQLTGNKEKMQIEETHALRIRVFKKRLAFPSSVMAMSHQLWVSGRTHSPHC